MTANVDLKISHADILKSINFAKIESLKKQLQEKDTEIDDLNHQLQEKDTEIHDLNSQQASYMILLAEAKSHVAAVDIPPGMIPLAEYNFGGLSAGEIPPDIYITEDNCGYVCEGCISETPKEKTPELSLE
uniref:Uncharacterized protein n=1 Tax=Pithovirus LCPAC201 TaxID=2506591 RepID=A0A481Z523_9VIRU|nr:MAG: hypothetical protein LCPAC201_02940 [Pithovirus LCPAC201]